MVDLVVNALQTYRPDLKIPGAAVASPAAVEQALAELATLLGTEGFGKAFAAEDHGISLSGNTWRAGLALPLSPVCFTAVRSLFHQIKNAMILGWGHGSIRVARREAKNVHWGTTVTDPARRLLRRHEGVVMELTSRSANVLRELVCLP